MRILPLMFFVLFCYILPVVLVFSHFFFVVVFYLLPFSLSPALHPTTESSVQHVVFFTTLLSIGLRLLHSYCFVAD